MTAAHGRTRWSPLRLVVLAIARLTYLAMTSVAHLEYAPAVALLAGRMMFRMQEEPAGQAPYRTSCV